MMNKEKNFVSAVVYLHNDGTRAAEFCALLVKELEAHFDQYELVAVDDACTDDTVPLLRQFAATMAKPLTILHMSLYQGLEAGMNAGLDAAIGDYVYEFDSTRHPNEPSMVFAAYQTALKGNDIVSVCPSRTTGGSGLFYKVFNASSHSAYKLRTDAFRLVTRRAINRVHASSEHLPYRKAAYAASGLKMADLEFDGVLPNTEQGRWNLAMDSLALYTVVVFATGHPIEGWTTTMLVLTVGFAGLFAVLTILVKYLSLLLDLTFKKQKYLVESIEKIQK